MPSIKFPLLKRHPAHYPDEAICPWCKEAKVFEPHSFVTISGGACIDIDSDEEDIPYHSLEGFLFLCWHGAHKHQGGVGIMPETSSILNIAEDISGGQFDIYFCSTKCLREFLNHCVDALEKNMEPGI